jgi:hypothetical protein
MGTNEHITATSLALFIQGMWFSGLKNIYFIIQNVDELPIHHVSYYKELIIIFLIYFIVGGFSS